MSKHPTHRAKQRWRTTVMMAVVVALVGIIALNAGSHGRWRTGGRDALRRFNRRWFNPVVLRFAGRAPWPVARLDHRGRRTGEDRATPVLAWPVAGGFVLPMPYGTEVDWAKNLLHAHSAGLQFQGVRYRVGAPRIAPLPSLSHQFATPIGSLVRVVPAVHAMRVDALPTVASEGASPV